MLISTLEANSAAFTICSDNLRSTVARSIFQHVILLEQPSRNNTVF